MSRVSSPGNGCMWHGKPSHERDMAGRQLKQASFRAGIQQKHLKDIFHFVLLIKIQSISSYLFAHTISTRGRKNRNMDTDYK